MPKREFRDERGITWMVWDVQPTLAERRRARVPIPPDFKERRLNHKARVPVDETLSRGWLVFRTAGERRRLAPIPADWCTASDEQLRDWCRRASPTIVWRQPIGGWSH